MNSKEILKTAETEVQEIKQVDEEKYNKLKDQTKYMKQLLEEQHTENEKLKQKLKDIESVAKKEKNKK